MWKLITNTMQQERVHTHKNKRQKTSFYIETQQGANNHDLDE